MRSNRDQAADKLEELKDMISAERLLDYLIVNYLSGTEALNAMISAEKEFFPREDEDEDEEEDEDYTVGLLYGVDNNQ